jgi:exosortase
MTDNLAPGRVRPTGLMILLALLAGSLLVAHFPILWQLAARWTKDPLYSHGWFVPCFSLYLLWWRKDQLVQEKLHISGWGLLIILVGELGILLGNYYGVDEIENMSLLVILTGVVVLVGGWAGLRWAWPALAFLLFMIPLPYPIESALAYPLRRIATMSSTYMAQTCGLSALAEGTDIQLGGDQPPIQVAPACSGLGMLLTFFALSTAFVLLVDRPLGDKIALLMSAIPIAIISNILRITITAMLFQTTNSQVAKAFFHDYAGYFMMVVGVCLLFLELKFLDHLFVAASARKPLQLALPAAPVSRAVPRLQHAQAAVATKTPTTKM